MNTPPTQAPSARSRRRRSSPWWSRPSVQAVSPRPSPVPSRPAGRMRPEGPTRGSGVSSPPGPTMPASPGCRRHRWTPPNTSRPLVGEPVFPRCGRRGSFCPQVTAGGQKTGCANRNLHVWTTGKAPRSRPWEGMARHPVGGGRWGAHRGNGASPLVRSAENLSRRQAECAGASLPKYISHNKAVRLDFQGKTMTARA